MRLTLALGLFLVAAAAPSLAAPEDVAEAALRATVRITNGASSGTGWFVAVPGPDGEPVHVLVTAHHVFDAMKTPEVSLVYRAPGQGGTFSRKEGKVRTRDGDKLLWAKHPELDVAALRVDVPKGVDLAPFPFDRVADESWAKRKRVRAGQDVFVPCFPVRLEASPAGWPLLRKGSIATHPLTPAAGAKTMLVDYAHFEGDSGAPLVAYPDGEPLVVGLVFALVRHTNTVTSPFEERKSHFPLDLAVAVQSPFVRAVIEKAAKK
ncbi:trypsin-like serine peptidase [Urbifossiella limnaea]|uniref:Serine protease n=1 Tax=Urbifossiella limnaea TaxID=2528023 RepID=A0A517XZP9_9BACT|nr:serine protease [Urbifossiella limnaea]QDU22987.1 hypothetical protein ETAA1_49770 [Urbifossiella limnaea]